MARYALSESTARWLRQMRNEAMPQGGAASGPGVAEPVPVPAPYRVRWAQSANGGAGAWIVWLPADCLKIGGMDFDPAKNLDAVGDPYPDGWYVLADIPSSGGDVVMSVAANGVSFGTVDATGAFFSLKIATVSRDSGSHVRVSPRVVGALAAPPKYIRGDDTAIYFTPVTDEEDENYGRIKVDVYYT